MPDRENLYAWNFSEYRTKNQTLKFFTGLVKIKARNETYKSLECYATGFF